MRLVESSPSTKHIGHIEKYPNVSISIQMHHTFCGLIILPNPIWRYAIFTQLSKTWITCISFCPLFIVWVWMDYDTRKPKNCIGQCADGHHGRVRFINSPLQAYICTQSFCSCISLFSKLTLRISSKNKIFALTTVLLCIQMELTTFAQFIFVEGLCQSWLDDASTLLFSFFPHRIVCMAKSSCNSFLLKRFSEQNIPAHCTFVKACGKQIPGDF